MPVLACAARCSATGVSELDGAAASEGTLSSESRGGLSLRAATAMGARWPDGAVPEMVDREGTGPRRATEELATSLATALLPVVLAT